MDKLELDDEELQRLLHSNLLYTKEYSFDEVWMIYVGIMNRDHFLGRYVIRQDVRFKADLKVYSKAYNSWLRISRVGNRLIYSLRQPEANYPMINEMLLRIDGFRNKYL